MKLSFSTRGWHHNTFEEFCNIASDLSFGGIELHNINNRLFTDRDGAFHDYAAAATLRRLYEKKLQIPCIDTLCDLSGASCEEETLDEIRRCMAVAENLHIPNVRLKATAVADESVLDGIAARIARVLPEAEEKGITLLLETSGIFAKTALLREMLNRFACDHLAALWNLSAAYFDGGESPEEIIQNLGAYLKHVQFSDGVMTEGGIEYRLAGEGDLPVSEMMLALRSVNYDGFISLVWDPKWFPELDDMEIIFTQFVNYMKQYSDTSRNEKTLYYNRARTGKFIWKKDLLIDLTFSQVLDRLVEEFPDQYAFKYTTLDYTRTYSEFRDDVDAFARSLISMGVKAGHHVAVWCSNVPQSYIAFWATVKIGAVLVTVNTAYKIAEVEYLLRQSDTHTLILTEGGKDNHYGQIIGQLCPELESMKGGEALHAHRLPFLRNVITVGFQQKGCMTWEDAIARADRVPVEEVYRMAALVHKDDVCNMQYPSGTTGFPKGVMLTHYNVVNNGKYIGDHMDLSTADRMMIQVPMFHCFGMVLSMTASMTHGTTMYPLPYFSPKPALACVHNEHITAFNGVPTMFIAMMQHEDFKKPDFSYMRIGIMAGANCPADLMKQATQPDNMNM